MSDNQNIKYKPDYKQDQVIVGNGSFVIVTGWTTKDSVAKKIDPSKYAVIGNLYSATRGISILIRNLLLNPQIDTLCLLDQQKEDVVSGSVRCLLDFFQKGFNKGKTDTNKDCWLINSLVTGYIDIEISAESLEMLRKHITVHYFTHTSFLVNWIEANFNKFSSSSKKETWFEPIEFPVAEVTTTTLPSLLINPRVEGTTIPETWVKLLYQIRKGGVVRPTGYGGNWQELINLVAIVRDDKLNNFPTDFKIPVNQDFMESYYPQILLDRDYADGTKYTYGQRLRSWFGQDQVEQVIEKLIIEIDSASAVMNLWDSGSGNHCGDKLARFGRKEGDSDHNHGGSPCLNHIWLRVVNGRLILIATFRSNDMFSAWCANAMGLRKLQYFIRDQIALRTHGSIDLDMGELVTSSQSAHIYDDCWDDVDSLIEKQYHKLYKKQVLAFNDPVGNFIITKTSAGVLIEQTTVGSGETVASYCNSNPLNLLRDITEANPNITPAHSGYLGIEIQKAFTQENYKQDR